MTDAEREIEARGGRLNAVDLFIAEADLDEARRIERAMAPVLNRVVVSTDAEAARDYLFRRPWTGDRRVPDLVLIDAALMGDGCWAEVPRIRRQPGMANVRIAILGSSPSIDDAERARDAGVDWIVGKPVSIEALATIVADLEDMGVAIVRRDSNGEEGDR